MEKVLSEHDVPEDKRVRRFEYFYFGSSHISYSLGSTLHVYTISTLVSELRKKKVIRSSTLTILVHFR